MSIHQSKSNGPIGCFAGLFILVVIFAGWALNSVSVNQTNHTVSTTDRPIRTTRNPIMDQLASNPSAERADGIAIAVLIDTSGSMEQRVVGENGLREPKLAIAQRRLLDLIDHVQLAATDNPDRKLRWGIYEFSSRQRGDACRAVLPLNGNDTSGSSTAIKGLWAEGGTPIGDAMIHAKSELNRSGLSRMHILVITDGENTQGYDPTDVAQAMTRLEDTDRATMYFIAFDIGEEIFSGVRDAGVLVLSAGNDAELRNTLDYVVTGKILAEQPLIP